LPITGIILNLIVPRLPIHGEYFISHHSAPVFTDCHKIAASHMALILFLLNIQTIVEFAHEPAMNQFNTQAGQKVLYRNQDIATI